GRIRVEGAAADVMQRSMQNAVSPRYFETIGQTLVRGRPFAATDARGAPAVAIVNETFARRYLGDDPIGKRFDPEAGTDFSVEVVGVVHDGTYEQVKEAPLSVFYMPYEQSSDAATDNVVLEMRSTVPQSVAARDVRAIVAALDPNVLVEI